MYRQRFLPILERVVSVESGHHDRDKCTYLSIITCVTCVCTKQVEAYYRVIVGSITTFI